MKAIPSTETVTIGVPVYRGELFIEETLRSIQMQTHQDIEVIISLDGPQPEAEELCEPFLKDPRFRLSIQPKRCSSVCHWQRSCTSIYSSWKISWGLPFRGLTRVEALRYAGEIRPNEV